jgi:hypothetical protein
MGEEQMKSIAICNAMLALFCIHAVPALAGPKSGIVEYTHSGSGATTFFSFDGKGVAFLTSTAGTGDLGKFTNQELFESQPTGNTCTVPGGKPNAGTDFSNLAGYVGIIRFSATSDLLYTQGLSVTECSDFSSGTPPFPFSGTIRGKYAGGTGKFAGASGTFITTFDGVTLAAPNNPGVGAFGSAIEHTRADLMLQNSD